MASKMARKAAKGAKKLASKIEHPPFYKTTIPAGQAAPSPPLGPNLGQRQINIAAFCKDFNEKTKDLIPGIPIPCRITINPDRSYQLVMHKPPVAYYLMKAAGIRKGTMTGGDEVAGKVTLKHVYEIARIKKEDPCNIMKTMRSMCEGVMSTAHSCGIQVVKELDPIEYGQFLEERRQIVQEQEEELEAARQSKLLRL